MPPLPVTPRHTVVLLLLTQAILAAVLAAFLGWKGDPDGFVAIAAALTYIGVLRAYQAGWEPARPLTVILITLLLVTFLREPNLTLRASFAIFVPPVLALVLTSASWVIGVSAIEYVALIARGGSQSAYLAPSQIVIFSMVVAGLALSRKVMDGAIARAAAQRERAEEARREAERRTQEVLAQSERLALLAQLLDAVDQGIFASGADGSVVYVNRAARVLAHDSEPLGRPAPQVLRLETPDGAAVSCSAAGEQASELVVLRPDGVRIPVLLTQTPIRGCNQVSDGFVTVCTDVSRIKRLEEDLNHARRLEGIGRLAGGVAHDFNNLLTVIGGAAAMAQRSLPDGHQAREDMEEILAAVDRSSELTRQLLAFARKQVLVKRPVDLSELVLGMERMLRRVIGEHIRLRTAVVPETLVVNADAGQIEQVVLNLSINARDAMPNGGTLCITTELETVSEAVAASLGLAAGDYVRLDVTDTGSGMSDDVQSRLFEPFFTTKPGGRGTGLGLSTCFGIVKQHEGHIQVESALDKGTRMRILLPTVNAATQEQVTQVRALPRGAERVLLVEDDDRVRKLLAFSLAEAGYAVTTAANGRLGLEQLEAGAFEVLVSDVIMPELGGVALAREARKRDPDLAVVLMSGYADSLVDAEQGALDGSVFLQKPFTPRELVQSIHGALLMKMGEVRRQG